MNESTETKLHEHIKDMSDNMSDILENFETIHGKNAAQALDLIISLDAFIKSQTAVLESIGLPSPAVTLIVNPGKALTNRFALLLLRILTEDMDAAKKSEFIQAFGRLGKSLVGIHDSTVRSVKSTLREGLEGEEG